MAQELEGNELLAEELRLVIGNLVRKVRTETQTPSSAQAETLGYIARKGSMSIAEMAALRQVKHQSMRLVIDQLQRQGLVARHADPADGRKQLIALTSMGKATVIRSRAQRAKWLANRIDDLTTSEDRKTLHAAVGILDRLLAHEPI
jgi:DNA-binding MarR family transcriptional regulator